MGVRDAEHEETAPGAPTLFISRLACSLVGKTQTIKIAPGSQAHRAYGQDDVTEQFFCNYGLNPLFHEKLRKGRMEIRGVDPDEEVRIVEISDHPFYVATLYPPQAGSKPESPHPLILGYVRAALTFQTSR